MPVASFVPLSSSLDPSFWHELARLKIDVLQLNEQPVPLVARYGRGRTVRDRETGDEVGLGCVASLNGTSFAAPTGSDIAAGQHAAAADPHVELSGTLLNYNTVEAFKSADKQAIFDQHAAKLWAAITTSAGDVTAAQLNTLFVLTFADLKRFKFFYWFSFPSFVASPAWETDAPGDWPLARDTLDVEALSGAYTQHVAQLGSAEAACCLVKATSSGGSSDASFATPRIADFDSFFSGGPEADRLLVYLDPSPRPSAAGWILRNILAFLAVRFGVQRIRTVCLRDGDTSRVVTFSLPKLEAYGAAGAKPNASGWEKNAAGKLAPRAADLGPMMDPRRLADQAVDLNLKLMRWRILPSLDLDRIKDTRCLLLGAGTLGCYVARSLMAWGVRKITLVDSGKVSYSNPVRQPLFDFSDCLEGGKPKAVAAADALKRIYPGVEATGLQLAIPMPGHPVPDALLEQTRIDVATLEKLMDEHDVVYLLMDSRESRWLPTIMGAAKGKLVMNAALGFDTFLVMRHGVSAGNATASDAPVVPGQPYTGRLGCYYCNDIVAPTDSLTDRTLDQMCTVTRPGLAAIASAMAVELMVSVLQHPQGSAAPSDVPIAQPGGSGSADRPSTETASVLGQVPHQIRGFLSRFDNIKITGRAYDRCTGCSDLMVKAYEKDGFEMLLAAFNDAKHLERVTGLDKLQDATDALNWDGDVDDEDDEAADM